MKRHGNQEGVVAGVWAACPLDRRHVRALCLMMMVPEGSRRARGGGGAAKEKGKTSHGTARITALGVRSEAEGQVSHCAEIEIENLAFVFSRRTLG